MRFRDQAHLSELVGRLARRSSSGAVMLRLRDGGEGMAVFPPAAPAGPILVLRRGEPGNATFEHLIAARTLDPPMVELLRIAAWCRLNVFVVGAEGSGKTALLVALARDLSRLRIVTLARHREFRWPQASKVELVVPSDAAFATLLAAAARLRPDLLMVDPLRPADTPALARLLSAGGRGILAAPRPQRWPARPGARWISSFVSVGATTAWLAWSPWKTRTVRPSSSTSTVGFIDVRSRRLLPGSYTKSRLRRRACGRAALIQNNCDWPPHTEQRVENPLPQRPIFGTNPL